MVLTCSKHIYFTSLLFLTDCIKLIQLLIDSKDQHSDSNLIPTPILIPIFKDNVLLYSSSWPQAFCVAQNGLELRNFWSSCLCLLSTVTIGVRHPPGTINIYTQLAYLFWFLLMWQRGFHSHHRHKRCFFTNLQHFLVIFPSANIFHVKNLDIYKCRLFNTMWITKPIRSPESQMC